MIHSFKLMSALLKNKRIRPESVGVLFRNGKNDGIGSLLDTENLGVLSEIHRIGQKKLEWRYIQRIALGRIHIAIFDHEVPAVGYDPQAAWRGIVEPCFAWALEIEPAVLLFAVGIGLDEGALQIR